MTRSRLTDDTGWTLVPVMVLALVGIVLSLALLAVVDTQTGQSRVVRNGDAAQTLAEGVVSATANVLANDQSATMWPAAGACRTVNGDLQGAPTGAAGSLDYLVAKEVQDRFKGSSSDFVHGTDRTTSWSVAVCPVQGTASGASWTQDAESRWEESMLGRTTTAPAGAAPARLALWVRARATVRSPSTATQPRYTRVVASKVRQSDSTFFPLKNYAVGTGLFSNDVGTSLGSTLTTNTSLVGSVASKTLGSQPLIADSSSSIGVRCGLLTTLDHPNITTCLQGSLTGLSGATNALGQGTLNTILGTNRTFALPEWTMAPADAIAVWKTSAQSSATVSSPAGYGDVRSKSVSGGPKPCFTGSHPGEIIYLTKVGNGEQYCDVPAGTEARMLIVERGGVRISGAFKGVVYALNRQECTHADTTQPGGTACDTADRAGAQPREVVRIDNGGKVTGQVWADGAGGQVGIYPVVDSTQVQRSSLTGVGGTSAGICGVGTVTSSSLMSTLTDAVAKVSGLVTGLLAPVIGTKEEVRFPDGLPSSATACDLLLTKLNGLSPTQILELYSTGGSQTIVTSEHRYRTCTLGLICTTTAWTVKDTASVNFPSLLNGASGILDQTAGLLGGTLGGYTAIQYDDAVRQAAAANLTQGAAPVVGSYRNVTGG